VGFGAKGTTLRAVGFYQRGGILASCGTAVEKQLWKNWVKPKWGFPQKRGKDSDQTLLATEKPVENHGTKISDLVEEVSELLGWLIVLF